MSDRIQRNLDSLLPSKVSLSGKRSKRSVTTTLSPDITDPAAASTIESIKASVEAFRPPAIDALSSALEEHGFRQYVDEAWIEGVVDTTVQTAQLALTQGAVAQKNWAEASEIDWSISPTADVCGIDGSEGFIGVVRYEGAADGFGIPRAMLLFPSGQSKGKKSTRSAPTDEPSEATARPVRRVGGTVPSSTAGLASSTSPDKLKKMPAPATKATTSTAGPSTIAASDRLKRATAPATEATTSTAAPSSRSALDRLKEMNARAAAAEATTPMADASSMGMPPKRRTATPSAKPEETTGTAPDAESTALSKLKRLSAPTAKASTSAADASAPSKRRPTSLLAKPGEADVGEDADFEAMFGKLTTSTSKTARPAPGGTSSMGRTGATGSTGRLARPSRLDMLSSMDPEDVPPRDPVVSATSKARPVRKAVRPAPPTEEAGEDAE